MNLSELEARYREGNPDGHFFDRRTLQWFGSTQRQARRESPGLILYSELQSGAPVQPWWAASLFTDDGRLVASTTGPYPTRKAAILAVIAEHKEAFR